MNGVEPYLTTNARTLAQLPSSLDLSSTPSEWAQAVLDKAAVSSFLEGPAFLRDGRLLVSDLAHGRLLVIGPAGQMSVFFEYDGEPNGLAVHRDGRIFIADYRLGLLVLDRAMQLRPVVARHRLEPFRGLSDLVFDPAGTLYFSDQGQSDLRSPTGRIFRWSESQGLELLMDGIPSPNGMAMDPTGSTLYVCVTRGNCLYRLPIREDGRVGKVGVHLHLSGGTGGPDGLAVDVEGGLAIAHYGLGRVWLFDKHGLLNGHVIVPQGLGTTNVAFGPHDGLLYVTESDSASVVVAKTNGPGLPLLSHADPATG